MAVPNTKRGDGGFTLLEMSVIVLILGVLLAVAAVTFLGSQSKASDAAARSRTVHAAKEQRALYSASANGSYGDWATLSAEDRSQKYAEYTGGAVPQVLGAVFVRDIAGTVAQMVARSNSGKCYWTQENEGVTSYAVNDCADAPTFFYDSWRTAESAG
jgi:prepilin-type N-terminal cleavage/methylation domain-containing protein